MSHSFTTEAGHMLRLALPLIIGQASAVGMAFVDTLMAGRLSALDLAAVAVGSTLWSSLNLFIIGTMLAVPAFISQFDGAGERRRMAPFIRQAAWVAIGLATLVFIGVRSIEIVLGPLQMEPEVIPKAGAYLDAISWGAFAWSGFLVLRFLSDGLGATRPFMYVGILGFLLNIPVDYVFMYGKLGLPAMGAEGCGYATALVLWCQFLVMLVYVARARQYRFLNLFHRWDWPRPERIAEILHVGLPIGISVFIESSMFMVATLLMGSLGTIDVAGHQVALNFAALLFMVPLGMAMAITVRVGNAAGRNDWQEVRFRGQAGLWLTLGTQTVSFAILLLFPEQITALYTRDPEVAAVAMTLLFYAAVFQLSDGMQVAAAGALRGIKDTRVPMIYMVLAYWIVGIPLSWWLGIHLDQRGSGIWIGLIAGLTVAATALTFRFLNLTRAHADRGLLSG